jgi:hypothetical protein
MISQPTVFVLGAGANVPYGFSTGGGLIDKLRGVDPRERMGNAGEQIRLTESRAFKVAMADNMLPSIDSMLEHRRDLVRVGKWLMATILYEQEAQARPRSFDEDWMALVFEKMSEGASTLSEFGNNPVSFVTFNYDRYMEYRFIRGLVARYSVDPRAAWAAISHMFVHLYGSLGQLPEQIEENASGGIPLGAPETEDAYTLGIALASAENMITIIHDTDQPPASFATALQKFQTARQCLFLGFGFGKKNVERLQMPRIPATTMLYCTTFGMTQAEVQDAIFPAFTGNNSDNLRHRLLARNGVDDRSIKQFLRDSIRVFT